MKKIYINYSRDEAAEEQKKVVRCREMVAKDNLSYDEAARLKAKMLLTLQNMRGVA